MAKRSRSFAEKVAAASEEKGRHCPECGELYQYVQYVSSAENTNSAGWKFNQRMIPVCKCNESEVMG